MDKITHRIPTVVFGLLAASLFLFSPLSAAKAPKIQFEEEFWDFGKVKQGEVLTHEFVFKNAGDSTLTVHKVRTSCGCTAALVSDQKVEPGKTGTIKVSFDSRTYAERVQKSVFVDSDDPSNPSKELTVSADIEVGPQARIDVDRYNLDLGLLLQGEPLQTKITIRNTGELELRVSAANQEAQYFSRGKQVAFPLKLAAGKAVELEIKIAARDRVGLIRDYVLLNSNDPLRSTISLYLSGYIITKAQLKEFLDRNKSLIN